MKMNVREIIKEKTLRLIGLVLITIPLMACYPILLHLGLSIKIAVIVTVCLSGVAYILLVTRIEPFLRRMLPFIYPKEQEETIMSMKTQKIQKATPAFNEERLRQLKQLFPECLTEGEVDLEKLNEILNSLYKRGG